MGAPMRPKSIVAAQFFFLALLLLLFIAPSARAQDATSITDGHLNFGGTEGDSGYGIRDNGGTIEMKNSGGSWAAPGGR